MKKISLRISGLIAWILILSVPVLILVSLNVDPFSIIVTIFCIFFIAIIIVIKSTISESTPLDEMLLFPFKPFWELHGYHLVKNNSEALSGDRSHAIVIAYTDNKIKNALLLAQGIDILINRFRNSEHPISYKVFKITSKEQFYPIWENEDFMYFWIFGHGIYHGVKIGKDFLFYCELKQTIPREFIGQYHCNEYSGKSLIDYNHPKHSDITETPRWTVVNRFSVEKQLKELNLV